LYASLSVIAILVVILVVVLLSINDTQDELKSSTAKLLELQRLNQKMSEELKSLRQSSI